MRDRAGGPFRAPRVKGVPVANEQTLAIVYGITQKMTSARVLSASVGVHEACRSVQRVRERRRSVSSETTKGSQGEASARATLGVTSGVQRRGGCLRRNR